MKITRKQLRQIISENRQQDLENKKKFDAWLATGKSKEAFPDYDEWGKEYIKSLEKVKVEESMKITRRQLRQIIKEEKEKEKELQKQALRASSSDINLSKDVVDAVLKAMMSSLRPRFPRLSHQVTERDAKGVLNALHSAGYKVINPEAMWDDLYGSILPSPASLFSKK